MNKIPGMIIAIIIVVSAVSVWFVFLSDDDNDKDVPNSYYESPEFFIDLVVWDNGLCTVILRNNGGDAIHVEVNIEISAATAEGIGDHIKYEVIGGVTKIFPTFEGKAHESIKLVYNKISTPVQYVCSLHLIYETEYGGSGSLSTSVLKRPDLELIDGSGGTNASENLFAIKNVGEDPIDLNEYIFKCNYNQTDIIVLYNEGASSINNFKPGETGQFRATTDVPPGTNLNVSMFFNVREVWHGTVVVY